MPIRRLNVSDVFTTLGLAACVAALLLNPLALGPSTAAWPNLFGLLAAGVCLLVAVISRTILPFEQGSRAAPWLLALAVFTLLFSALQQGFTAMSSLFILTAVLMFALGAALQWIDARVLAPALGWGLLVAALLNVLIGWLQFANVASAFSPWVNQLAVPGQVYGNLRQPNQYASVMAMGLAALWWVMRTQARVKVQLPLLMICVLMLISGTVLSGSRAGFLELVLLAIAAWCWRGERGQRTPGERQIAWVFMSLPLLYFVEWAFIKAVSEWLGLAMMQGVERLTDSTGSNRDSLWHNVIHLIAERPFAGYGVHELGYAHFMADFSTLTWWPGKGRFMTILDNAHNALLHSWVELGLIGVVLSVGALTVGTLHAKPWREVRADKQMAWLIIGALSLHSLLEYPLHYAQFWLPFCLALNIAFSKYSNTQYMLEPESNKYIRNHDITNNSILNHQSYGWPAYRVFFFALSCVCLIVFAYAAWDYDRVSQAYSGPQRRAVPLGVDRMAEAQKSWLFAPYARFAKLMLTPMTPENASLLLPELREMLHFSAEPRVLDKLLLALKLTAGDNVPQLAEISFIEARYAAAFPTEYAQYRASTR